MITVGVHGWTVLDSVIELAPLLKAGEWLQEVSFLTQSLAHAESISDGSVSYWQQQSPTNSVI